MTTFMFPGQGSQFKGMGVELFTKGQEEIAKANNILGYSVEDLCLHDPNKQLANTRYTQPALFVVECLTYQFNKPILPKPDYCIGHSLGEYSALYAAGAFDFITGLQLVKKRGELMAEEQGGAMLAVIDLTAEIIQSILAEAKIDSIDFANFNSSRQLILSGPFADIERAKDLLSKSAKQCILLPVSGAFHSRYMQDAAAKFETFLKDFKFSKMNKTVIANATVEPYTDDTIKELLVKQITSPVHWDKIIQYLKKQGETEFIDLGPGRVLTGLMRQN